MRKILRPLLTGLALTLVAVTLYGWLEAHSDPIVRRATIPLAGMAPDAPPLRIALVSDIHVGNLAMPVERLDRIVDQINAQRPDVVLLADDFVNGKRPDSWSFYPWKLVAPLSRLKAPLGIYAVMGNHDDDTRPALVQTALRRAHVTVLDNDAARIGPIALAGMDDQAGSHSNPFRALKRARQLGGVPVVLTHSPQMTAWIGPGMPLLLAGHTHCGQIMIGKAGRLFDMLASAHQFNPRYRCGVIHDPGRIIIVTAGIGAASELPLRINAPPDFWMITLVGRRVATPH